VFSLTSFPEDTTNEAVIQTIESANVNPIIDGILVQLPLPKHLNTDKILNSVLPSKDVDGLGPVHIGNLTLRVPSIRPCTPYGIITLLEHYKVPVKGKHAVIVGASNIVGRPMLLEFLLAGATCTICHRFTNDLEEHVRRADILATAVGKRHIVKSEWIKQGSVVVDVGMNRNENGKLCGDVDFKEAIERASYVTPVPGGVGPMTVITLMKNVMKVYEGSCRIYQKIQPDMSCDCKTIYKAAKKGHLECLKRLNESPTREKCPEDEEYATAWLARGGHLECLKYMYESGSPWSEWTTAWAAGWGQLKCLEYAHEKGCPWHEKTANWAEIFGHSECLWYARENGPSDYWMPRV
jgi:methylenetetrahydrofolate dehydrogenase (NADP+)/methenyltetrahydrofolate cyclohydrolase